MRRLFQCATIFFLLLAIVLTHFSTVYAQAPTTNALTTTTGAFSGSDPDINIRLRTPQNVTGTAQDSTLGTIHQYHYGSDAEIDLKSPQLDTLFPGAENAITSLWQLHELDGTLFATNGTSNWGATVVGFTAQPGTEVKVPQSGYSIGGGYQVTVLYIDEAAGDITFTYTDGSSGIKDGYSMHVLNIDINPELLVVWREAQATGKLVALPCGYVLGTMRSSEMRVSIRDTGTFLDPRNDYDWWIRIAGLEPTPLVCGTDDPLLVDKPKVSPYYLYPIKTITENKSPDMIRAELTLQGYEAYCSVPKMHGYVKDTFTDEDFAINPGLLGQLFEIEPEYTYDYSQSMVPLWRNMNIPVVDLENTQSLEGFWSHRNLSETDSITRDIASAPIYRLTTLGDQCRLQTSILHSIDQKCNALENPANCALNITIPQVDLKAQSLYALYQQSGLDCDEIAYQSPSLWKTSLSTEDKRKLATGLSNTPLYMPDAYRLAFLVIYAEIKDQPDIFNFLSRVFPNIDQTFNHDVRVIAFKIPDVATNKHDIEIDLSQLADLDSGERQELQALVGSHDSSSYRDATQLTADAILPLADRERRQENWLEQKVRWLSKDSYVHDQFSAHTIKCRTEYCEQNAVRALIDFANVALADDAAQLALCDTHEEDKKAESASTIQDEGGLNYDEEEPTSLENITNNQGISQKPEEESIASGSAQEEGAPPFNFLARYWLNGDRKGRFSPFRGVLIYPQGHELTNIEDALAGLIYTTKEIEQLKNDPAWQEEEGLKKYFELADTGQAFPKDSQEITVGFDQECIANLEGDNLNDIEQCAITREVYSDAEPIGIMTEEPRILGGVLGFLTRKVQQALHVVTDPVNRALAECKSTEDFLLGRCGEADKENTTAANMCTDSTQIHEEMIEVQRAQISEGLIQLAMEVSERTCTPVEVLIGVLAKETKGLDFNNVPATGDPNQQICRTQKCVDNVYGNGGGPYSFTLGLPPEFIGTFNSHISHAEIAPLYQECINNLSVMLSSGTMTLDARTAPQDGRIMGQSMCAFSANFWRYMSRPKLDSRLTQYPSCTGENKRSYALSEITQNNLDYFLGVHFAPGACTDPSSDFHIACLDGVRLFNLSIQLYKDDVQAVVNACRG